MGHRGACRLVGFGGLWVAPGLFEHDRSHAAKRARLGVELPGGLFASQAFSSNAGQRLDRRDTTAPWFKLRLIGRSMVGKLIMTCVLHWNDTSRWLGGQKTCARARGQSCSDLLSPNSRPITDSVEPLSDNRTPSCRYSMIRLDRLDERTAAAADTKVQQMYEP